MKNFLSFGLVCLCVIGLVTLVVGSSVAEDVTVKMSKEEAAQYRLGKINQEYQALMQGLRTTNPEEFKKLDALQAEAQQIAKDNQPKAQAPAPAQKKK